MSKALVVALTIFLAVGVGLFLSQENGNESDLVETVEDGEDKAIGEKEEIQGEVVENEENKEKNDDDSVFSKENGGHTSFVECLAENGVVIYGSRTCPACASLSEEYGGYEKMKPIYVECTVEQERCIEEMLVGYVPVVQINGEIFDDWGSPENLARETGCRIDD